MKFHHMTICSPNGGPPSSSTLVSSSALSASSDVSGSTKPSSWPASGLPSTRTLPVSTSTPSSYDGSTGTASVVPPASASSAPSSGVYVVTGEVEPSSEPMNTRASQPSPDTGSGAKCSNPGST